MTLHMTSSTRASSWMALKVRRPPQCLAPSRACCACLVLACHVLAKSTDYSLILNRIRAVFQRNKCHLDPCTDPCVDSCSAPWHNAALWFQVIGWLLSWTASVHYCMPIMASLSAQIQWQRPLIICTTWRRLLKLPSRPCQLARNCSSLKLVYARHFTMRWSHHILSG